LWAILYVIHYPALVALAASLMLVAFVLPASAQKLAPEATIKNDTKDLRLIPTGGGEPILTQLSEKGIYKVELRWPQITLNPQGGIQAEIVFLNASAPKPTSENIPTKETNLTGAGPISEPGLTVPGTLESPLPIDSYDMIIYSSDGKELWKKLNQPGLGGRGTQTIQLEGNYTGPVTIEINNIKPGWDTGGTTTANDMTDSVKFAATVVPEFPVAASLLAAGVATTIAVIRLRPARIM
jgi:hypothetical protein